MQAAVQMCQSLGVPCEARVLSAHRTPDATIDYARTARDRGIACIIAAAGGAAHLAGVVAAATLLPVIGVPIEGAALRGMDSLLSTVQMPRGIPVATVAINGAANAALLACRILALTDPAVWKELEKYRDTDKEKILATQLEY